MLMDDLGEPDRQASDDDGAHAAARLHKVNAESCPWLARVDQAALAVMPHRIAASLEHLGLPEPARLARRLEPAAAPRAAGTGLAPFGFCHSEYHPTSLHIGRRGWQGAGRLDC